MTKEEVMNELRQVIDYNRHRALSGAHEKILKSVKKAKKYPAMRYEIVRTPNGQQYILIYYIEKYSRKNQGMLYNTLVVPYYYEKDGRIGYVAYEPKRKSDTGDVIWDNITVLHRHAIDRYVERHGTHFEGLGLDVYVFGLFCHASFAVEDIVDSIIMNTDEGMFLGNMQDGIVHARTFILHRQAFDEQKLLRVRLENGELNSEPTFQPSHRLGILNVDEDVFFKKKL